MNFVDFNFCLPTIYIFFFTQSKTIEEIESKINGGQVEELIRQGELEVVVARRFSLFKPWEELTAHPPKNQWTWPPTK